MTNTPENQELTEFQRHGVWDYLKNRGFYIYFGIDEMDESGETEVALIREEPREVEGWNVRVRTPSEAWLFYEGWRLAKRRFGDPELRQAA